MRGRDYGKTVAAGRRDMCHVCGLLSVPEKMLCDWPQTEPHTATWNEFCSTPHRFGLKRRRTQT